MVQYILDKKLVNPDSNNEVIISKVWLDWFVFQVVGTSLALAHMMCYDQCIEVLQKSNVHVDTQNKVTWFKCPWKWNDVVCVQYSQTPLHEAIDSGMIDHCSYLIDRTQDIDRPGFVSFRNELVWSTWLFYLDGVDWLTLCRDKRIRGTLWWIGEEWCWLSSIC